MKLIHPQKNQNLNAGFRCEKIKSSSTPLLAWASPVSYNARVIADTEIHLKEFQKQKQTTMKQA
jgi:hypothetical protein